MISLGRIFRRARNFFRRRQLEAEMAEEMRFHLEQRTADYAADDLPAPDARLAAERRFGNMGSIQEQAREARGWGWLERLGKDIGFGVRQLVKSPGFTVLAILTLGCGIGANTAMFSALNSIIIKPLPYPHSEDLDRLYRVTESNAKGAFSVADFLDLRRGAQPYGEIAGYQLVDSSLTDPGQPPEVAPSARVTANFFDVLGLVPQLGRGFRAGEDTPGNDRVLILSRRCWQNRFGASSDVIGHTVRVDGDACVIVGVLPEAFNDWRHFGAEEFFRPLSFDRSQEANRRTASVRIIGRRSSRMTAGDAAQFVAAFGARQVRAYPDVNAGAAWRAMTINATVVSAGAPVMMSMLVGLSGFVLLIACSNLANLLLARAMARTREFAVRSALGASRLQLLRPLIVESLLLSLAGCACALVFAMWATDWLSLRSTGDNGERVMFTFDWTVLGWALGASFVTAIAFGLAPALFTLRLDLNQAMKSGGRGTTGGRGHQRFRHALIVGQFALAMTLLAGAGLFVDGLKELNERRSGWSSEHLVTGTILLPAATYSTPEKIAAFHRIAIERLEHLPGVASAALSGYTPFFDWFDAYPYLIAGKDRPQPGHEPMAEVNTVSAHYFDAVGTRIVAGRSFDARDTLTSPKVFLISQATARAWFGDENPIGRRIARAGHTTPEWGEIVGVVNDVRSVMPDEKTVSLQLYDSIAQEPFVRTALSVRSSGVAQGGVIDGVRAAIAALDPDLPVRDLQTADAAIVRANYELGVLRDMLTAFALLGLGLAALGIYGVIARMMAQRSGEFAIRLALGASVADIRRNVLGSGVKLALIGSAVGLLGAYAVSQLLVSGFRAMQFHSGATMILTTLFLVGVALLASYLPARRAARIDAAEALRLD